MLKLSDFDYELPKQLIAQYPLEERDKARLLVLNRQTKTIEHRIFEDITDYFTAGDLLVLNDTKVLPCRLIGSRLTGGRAEVLLLKPKGGATFEALIKPGRLRLNEKLVFGAPVSPERHPERSRGINGGRIYGKLTAKNEITFNVRDAQRIYGLGCMPLPPYIKRKPQGLDNIYYQTVYARENGAVAAPTAGLHFTKELIRKMESSGINIAYLTLHVGLGTFKPVRAGEITAHKMEPEHFKIPPETIGLIKKAQAEKRRVFAAGTTSLRALESYGRGTRSKETDLFIYPGYKFKIVSCLLTNFHLPRTTLFILVAAFAGEKLAKKAYAEAIGRKYRFYSYGDAMLII